MNKTTLAESARSKIEGLNEGLEAMAQLPDTVVGMAASGFIEDGYVALRFPFNLEQYRLARRILLDDGWKPRDHNPIITGSNGGRAIILNNNGHQLTLWMMDDLEGSTCKRKKVGEKIIDVYRVTCK